MIWICLRHSADKIPCGSLIWVNYNGISVSYTHCYRVWTKHQWLLRIDGTVNMRYTYAICRRPKRYVFV